jgi:2'-5' RNA ligase
VAPISPFSCAFEALRWFGRRVLWLAPEPVAPFREIAGRIRCQIPGLAPQERELVPHLTVGLRRAAPAGALRAAEEALAPQLPLTVRIDRVALMVRAESWGVGAEAPLRG